MTEYKDIKELINIFDEHSKQSKEQYQIARKRHIEEFGEELPYEFFDIANCFRFICEEINSINKWIDNMERPDND